MLVKRLRNILVLLATTGIFISAAVIALILARGSQITPGGIFTTGTIRVEVNPVDQFEIFLDQVPQRLSANSTLANIQPGEYELTVSSNNYTSWTQRINVEAGLVTDVAVQLFPKELNLQQISQTNLSQIEFGPSRRYAYYVVSSSRLGSNIGIWQEPLFTNSLPLINQASVTKLSNLNTSLNESASKGELILLPSPTDERLIVRTPGQTHLLRTGVFNELGANTLLDFSFPVDEISWLRDSSTLLLKSSGLLVEYDIESTRATVITFAPGTDPIYTKAGNGIIFYEDGKLQNYIGEKATEIELENVTLPTGISSITAGTNNIENFVFTVGSELYFLNITESFLERIGNYSLLTVSPNGRNMIVADESGIFSINITISAARNTVRVDRKPSILPRSADISSIVWSPDSAYFIYQEQGDTSSIHSADNLGNNIATLFESETLSGTDFTIPADNTGIILSLIDNSAQAESHQINLYRLGFVL